MASPELGGDSDVWNAGQAWAAPIPIINHGFEDPVLADGARTNTTFTIGWQFTGETVNGVWNPSAAQAYGGHRS